MFASFQALSLARNSGIFWEILSSIPRQGKELKKNGKSAQIGNASVMLDNWKAAEMLQYVLA